MDISTWIFIPTAVGTGFQLIVILLNGKFFSGNPDSYIKTSKKFMKGRPILGRLFFAVTVYNLVALFALFFLYISRGIK